MIQLHRPVSFHPLPQEQQFQHLPFCSNGHTARGHLGERGEEKKDAGSAANDGGVGYGSACTVKLAQGFFEADEPRGGFGPIVDCAPPAVDAHRETIWAAFLLEPDP
jgi:hypothetical protein